MGEQDTFETRSLEIIERFNASTREGTKAFKFIFGFHDVVCAAALGVLFTTKYPVVSDISDVLPPYEAQAYDEAEERFALILDFLIHTILDIQSSEVEKILRIFKEVNRKQDEHSIIAARLILASFGPDQPKTS